MNVGIVGCGLIGHKRAAALRAEDTLAAVADIDGRRAEQLASHYPGCRWFKDPERVLADPSVELVIVATPNNLLAPIALEVAAHRKHVLLEKPGACRVEELERLIERASDQQVLVKVGFNHRFHPAFLEARKIWDRGELGDLLYIRGRYGHGGRLGYEKEWRADPNVSGGGELLDQGVHLIDLSRWFAGEFSSVEGHIGTYFWNMPVEDNAFMLLKTRHSQVAWLHVSWTEWKNLFSFEIFGRTGKLQVDGLGGSYGTERLTYYKMSPEMKPPVTTVSEYPGEDRSWLAEFDYFARCIERGEQPEGNLQDALEAMRIVHLLYKTAADVPPPSPCAGQDATPAAGWVAGAGQ